MDCPTPQRLLQDGAENGIGTFNRPHGLKTTGQLMSKTHKSVMKEIILAGGSNPRNPFAYDELYGVDLNKYFAS